MFCESLSVLDCYDDIVNLLIDYRLSQYEQSELTLELLANINQLNEHTVEEIRVICKKCVS